MEKKRSTSFGYTSTDLLVAYFELAGIEPAWDIGGQVASFFLDCNSKQKQ